MVGDSIGRDPPGPAGKVLPFVPSLSRARATDMVRGAVTAGRWSIKVQGSVPSVLSRQIERVVSDGQILEEIVEFDGKEFYQFRMLRVCAGVSVEIEVALEAKTTLPHLFVNIARGEQI